VAPPIPVMATATMVKDGRPPVTRDTSIEIGMVADLGASDSRVSNEAPNSQPMPSAERMAVTEPTISATLIGNHKRFKRLIWLYRGTARATVDGPIRKSRKSVPWA